MEVIIPQKIYGDRSGIEKLNKKLKSLLGDLDVKWRIAITKKQWVKIILQGEDSEISANLIREEFGEIPRSLSNVNVGDIFVGRLIDLGKVGYGVYVDIGILTPRPKDALLPLYWLKRTFEDKPVRQMIREFGWVDNLPVEVRIEKVERLAQEIEVYLTEKWIKKLKGWLTDKHDKLFIAGTISENVENALIQTGHSRDVRRIEELGLMETMLILKKGTHAPGIIKEIGPYIRAAKIGAIKFED
ncbi:DUF2110 domain-containing protein [Pyrococcus furiosus DSM 3638]|uniref:DUF2110 domain-containing protein n=3 Tax=Pyrococcus furiosus TaxID=2261 RepID=A0A5C0XMU9_PYRFU|nr:MULTISPECIES: DUF2110 family protein [Pyrococcus]AAL80614.1 hypothetical protein PF0490 [Pyrococcus furiosus DSM 3638]AFN03284.1 hypothetical protein PFC_01565 [Pyrococcus furiosus COM1]MDK2869365.1 hypothetical protein [Pyrococcus sp.]QEK78203.1 DUF2110 domain-containing protein [Pyrococcus furiosus DSM 3638]